MLMAGIFSSDVTCATASDSSSTRLDFLGPISFSIHQSDPDLYTCTCTCT